MGQQTFTILAGSMLGRNADGAPPRSTAASNFAFLERVFHSGVVRRTNAHGFVIPADLDTSVPIKLKALFRQNGSGTGVVSLTFYQRVINEGDNRDDVALSVVSTNTPVGETISVPGVVGKEFALEQSISALNFKSGQELLLGVERIGTNVADNHLQSISLIRLDVTFTTLVAPKDPIIERQREVNLSLLEEMVKRLREINFIIKYHGGEDW